MSVLCRFARRAQRFLRGAERRKDFPPEESPCVGGPISMQYSNVLSRRAGVEGLVEGLTVQEGTTSPALPPLAWRRGR